MFCKKCGTQLNENAKFCAVCGTPVTTNANQQMQQPAQQAAGQADPFAQPQQTASQVDPCAQPQQAMQQGKQVQQQWSPTMKPKKSKAPLILGIVGAALVVVIALVVVLLFACGGGKGASSPQEAAEAYFAALNDKDLGDIKDIMYPAVFNEAYDEDLYEDDEFVEMVLETTGPIVDAENPKSASFGTVKITDKENASTATVKSYNSNLKNADGYVKIEKAADVKGSVVIKVDGEKATYKFSGTVVMADGKWYIANISVRSYPMDDEE